MAEGRHALIIANFNYEDPGLRQLIAPPQDAENLNRVLADPKVGDFTVKALLNEDSRKVMEEIEDFFEEKKPDDLLLLYFSGHGLKDDEGHLYYAFPDTKLRRVRSTAVGADFINRMMLRSRSRRQVVILDCCYSGAFARGMVARADRTINTKEILKEGRGRVVITASDAMQYAFEGEAVEGEGVPSVFTKYLIEGLETGAADPTGEEITLKKLYDYAYKQVKAEVPQQSPQMWGFGLEGEICIACNPHPVIKPAELPKELLESTKDVLHWVREGTVSKLEELLRVGDKRMVLAAYEALKLMKDDDSRKIRDKVNRILEEYDAKLPPESVEPPVTPAVVEEEKPPPEEVAPRIEATEAQPVEPEIVPEITETEPATEDTLPQPPVPPLQPSPIERLPAEGPWVPDEQPSLGTVKDLQHEKAPWHEVLKAEIDRLPIGKVAFNPPDTMKLGVRERVETRISRDLNANLVSSLKGRGFPHIDNLIISEFMKVRLSGDDFYITPLNEEEQIILATGFTEWAWDVIARKSGRRMLHLHITLRIKLPFGEERKDHPILDREIAVQVNPIYSVRSFIVTNWKWIVTVLILPLIGWIWKMHTK